MADTGLPTNHEGLDRDHQPSTVLTTTGPVGESGLPPSRPTSNTANSASRTRSTAPQARVGSPVPSLGGRGGGSYQNDPSRRTHVPNLISSAFLPTSPRRTDPQSPPPTSPQQPQLPIARPSTDSGRRTHRSRNSNASIVTLEQSNRPRIDPDAPPLPTSRGTGTTNYDFNRDLQPFGSAKSQESQYPLRKPPTLDIDGTTRSTSSLQAQKSPISLRASWSRQSRSSRVNGRSADRDGHEKLPSVPPSPANYKATPVLDDYKPSTGRNYQYFNGNAVFFLRGRLINTRQRPLNVFTALLAIIPAALFFGFSAPWLWHHVSPAIPILFAYVFFICLSSYLHASFSEPGIIPRNLHPQPPTPADEDPLAIGPSTTEWVTVRSFAPSAGGNTTTAMEVPIKFCKSCNIWRPPRAHHCRICDSCIETQDHHCVWLNNCVGRRNYRYFLTFVASGTVLGLFLLAASLTHILVWMHRNNSDFAHALNVWRVPAAMCVYSFIILTYPLSLWGYHLFLMGRGETTREYLNSHKFQKKDRHRPFSQHSILKNWSSVFTRPRPPTYMRFRHRYAEGDQRLGELRSKTPKQTEKDGDVEMGEINAGAANSNVGYQGQRTLTPINNTPRG
ncbi:zf-DHHC-domain-containing protein [Aureobasidium pullulans EXF-150]|uniref:Palmitoyltransferase n=1 Tax=Aureobasidium pullulans EXF-150 TaxID=1043002 RepID=A0A074XZN8_AURPU|nr:zf-DHHC-domain-containing protein [Aureobasidium pullulans EXF-150]KEQ89094.1 zf-DHHC-domain-containing protein [Aureobasidium pullulans EXF-150]